MLSMIMAMSLFTQQMTGHVISCQNREDIRCSVQVTHDSWHKRTHVIYYRIDSDGDTRETVFSGTPRGNTLIVDRAGTPGRQFDSRGTCTINGRVLSCETPHRAFRGTIR